jgi:hypothetical protein
MVKLKPNLDLLMIQILKSTPFVEVQSWTVTEQSRLYVSVSCCRKLSCVDVVVWSWDQSVVPSVWSCSCVHSLQILNLHRVLMDVFLGISYDSTVSNLVCVSSWTIFIHTFGLDIISNLPSLYHIKFTVLASQNMIYHRIIIFNHDFGIFKFAVILILFYYF